MNLKILNENQKMLFFGGGRPKKTPSITATETFAQNTPEVNNLDSAAVLKYKKTSIKKPKASTPKNKTTFGIKDVGVFKFGSWSLAIGASVIGLISNINAAIETTTPQVEEDYSSYNYQYNKRRSASHSSAQSLKPFIRLNANPLRSTISFGAPSWFF